MARGAKILPRELTGPLFSSITNGPTRTAKTLLTDVRMTTREREVVELIAEGLRNKEIAQRLHLATYTVKNHVHHILEKLALRSRLQIAGYARSEGNPKASR